jgi:hypothetical protein
MRKILAVALLDVRRLGFGVASGALVAGLVPALASGLGAKAEVGAIVAIAFVVVGIAAGGTFGSDFSEGKSSFFFARPLPAGVLIVGRFAALLALAAAAFFSFMASFWVSSSDRSAWTLSVLTRVHGEVLLSAWALALFVSLAAAARGRGVRVEGGMRAMVLIPIRLTLAMGAFLLMFGLFADLVLRAYFSDFTPIRIFGLSWVAASLVASCVAIAGGRTERLRISRLQGRVMAAHFALVSAVVVGAWIYVLHPGVSAMQRVDYPTWGSPDGRSAYVSARVDRGDGTTFRPVFILDIASGEARRLNADAYQGPWVSADGATMVWSEATPFFFRPLWRHMGGTTTFRVKTAAGEATPLPMPDKFPDYRSVRDLSTFGAVDWILPSPDGDVIAIEWYRHLTFTSRSRGEMSDIYDEGQRGGASRGVSLREAVFLPSGVLRATRVLGDGASGQSLTFVDIDPKSGSVTTVASIRSEGAIRAQLDTRGARALLTSTTQPGRGASLALVDLGGAAAATRPTALMSDVLSPSAIFLADGRIAVTNAGSVGAWRKRALKIFSPTGQMVLDIPIGDGMGPRLGREMFPGVLGMSLSSFTEELTLIDLASGSVIRQIPNVSSPRFFLQPWTPPGTPAARLLLSRDGTLYELPSVTAEPRRLLPLTAGREQNSTRASGQS